MEKRNLLESSDSEDGYNIYSQTIPPKKKKNDMIEFNQLHKIIKTGDLSKIKDILNERNLQLSGTNGSTVLHVAAASDNKDLLTLLLTDKRILAQLNRQDIEGVTPLMTAMKTNSYGALELLCAQGADLCKTLFKNRDNILHVAAKENHRRAAEILLNYNTSPEFINAVNLNGNTPLIEAVISPSSMLDLLLRAGADITVQNIEDGRTLLHVIVARNSLKMLKVVLKHPQATVDFAEIKDVKDDTALLIAVKLDRLEMVHLFLSTFDKLTGINHLDKESVFHIAVRHDRVDIVKLLVNSGCKSCIDYMDYNNRTPLLYAAELDKASCLEELIENGGDYNLRNSITGENFMHVIAKNFSSTTLPCVLKINDICWFFIQPDFQGNTPYMTAITNGNSHFLQEALKVKQIDLCDESREGEPPVYYTVKHGNLKTMMALLMSPKYYCNVNKKDLVRSYDMDDIIQLELRGDLYATDVFILSGKVIKHPLVPWFPPGLLRKTRENRNVFHACALGGNLGGLRFLYEFFSLFGPRYLKEMFDRADLFGNTPLLFAAQCGVVSISCVHFFVTHGAVLDSVNNDGLNVFNAILTYNPEAAESLIVSLLDSCVAESKEHYYEDKININLNFSMLCPKESSQLSIIYTLFNEMTSHENISVKRKVLQHPVVETLLRYKYKKMKYFLILRLLLIIFVTNMVGSVMPMLFIGEDTENIHSFLTPSIQRATLRMVLFLSFTLMVLKTPHLVKRDLWLTDAVAFLPLIMTVILMCVGRNFTLTPELTAITILFYYIYFMVYTTTLYFAHSFQIAVFFQILNSIAKHFVILTVMIFAFALSFFCIYHKVFRFSTFPTSLIYTLIVLLPGHFSDMPSFEKDYFTSTPITFHFIVECLTLGAFILMVVIGFINMLVGLAVRSANEAELDGMIYKQHLQAHFMFMLEYFFDNRLCLWFLKKGIFTEILNKLQYCTKIKLDIGLYDVELKPVVYDSLIRQFMGIAFENNKQKRLNLLNFKTKRSLEDLNYNLFYRIKETPSCKTLIKKQALLEEESTSQRVKI